MVIFAVQGYKDRAEATMMSINEVNNCKAEWYQSPSDVILSNRMSISNQMTWLNNSCISPMFR